MQCTTDFHHAITDARLPEAADVVDAAAALDAAVDVLDAPFGPIVAKRGRRAPRPPPRTVRVRRIPARDAGLPIETPVGHMGLKGSLKGWDQLPQLVHGETGQIEHLCRAGLELDEPSRSHDHGLLSLEA